MTERPMSGDPTGDKAVAILREWLKREEGVRTRPYKCTAGKWTIGVGRNFEDNPLTTAQMVRYFNKHPMTMEDIDELLEDDIADVLRELRKEEWFSALTPVRQAALANMAFQMGVPGLMKFTTTLRNVKAGQYQLAASSGMNSRWAQQTPARAKRVMDALVNDEVPR